MNWSRNRIIVASLLTAALGLMLCPPWKGEYNATRRIWLSSPGHRLLWNGRGSLDSSRLALELCLVGVIGALAAVVAPMVRRLSARDLKVPLRRGGLVLAYAALLTLAATTVYDGITRIVLLHDYDRKVQEFKAEAPLLREAFPLKPVTYLLADDPYAKYRGYIVVNPISNVHEAEVILRSLGCDELGIQRATARFLSASTPEYEDKGLTFVIGASEAGKGGNCLPKDIFDEVAATRGAALPSQEEATKQARADIDLSAGLVPYREIVFGFRTRDSDEAKQFFSPLPDWYIEALQEKIEVARVPDWMKPGAPVASWSFRGWLDSRRSWLIFAAGMLAVSVLCFVVANRIDGAAAKNGVETTA